MSARVEWRPGVNGDDITMSGTVLRGRRRAWTPVDLTADPPAANMVVVLWDGDREPRWEYEAELVAAGATAQPNSTPL